MVRQNGKRIIGLLCVLLLLLGCFIQPAWAAGRYPDVENHVYQQAIDVLSAMGIVEGNDDGAFGPDLPVTRAEMVVMVLRALDLSGTVDQGLTNPFADTAGHWAEGYISLAEKLGYIDGNGDGTFEPEADVTFEQAVKMAVNMIAYAVSAEDRGGYPAGYLTVANSKGLLDRVNGKTGEPLTKGQVAQLIYNTMQVPMLIQDSFGENSAYHEGTEQDTLLARFMALPDSRGIVTAVQYTGLNQTTGTGQADQVEISIQGTPYLMYTGDTDAQRYLGREVDFRAVKDRRDSTRYTLIYIQPTERCEILELRAEEIDRADREKMTYTYTSDTGKSRTVRLDEQAKLIYNNQYLEEPAKEDMIPENGFVLLIENDGSTGYDVVFVYDFVNLIVASANAEGDIMRIRFKSGSKVPLGQVEIDRSAAQEGAVVYLDGAYLTTERLFEKEIQKWTVASVAESRSGDVAELRLSTRAVTGAVEGKRQEDGAEQYQIAGKWYPAAPEFTEKVKPGDRCTFLISYDEKIVAINTEMEPVTKDYALLLQSVIADNAFDSGNAEFKLILADGRTVTREGTDKVRINQESAKKLTRADLESIPNNSLILFTANSGQKITAIETADSTSVCTTTNGYIDYGEEHSFTLNASTDLYFKNASPATLGGDVKVDDSTLVFDVSSSDDEEWGAGDISLFSNETVYTVDIYDLDRFKRAKVVVNHGPTVEQKDLVPWSGSPVVIQELITMLDEEGDTVTAVVGMQDGREFEMRLKDQSVCDEERENYLVDLQPGSVVQIKKNMLDEIVSIRKLYRAPSDTTVYETLGSKNWNGTDYNVKLHTGYGMCVDMDEEVMTVAYRLDNRVRAYSISQANIYIFDSRNREVRKAETGDAKPASAYGYDECSRVFVRMEKDDVKDVVIYD